MAKIPIAQRFKLKKLEDKKPKLKIDEKILKENGDSEILHITEEGDTNLNKSFDVDRKPKVKSSRYLK